MVEVASPKNKEIAPDNNSDLKQNSSSDRKNEMGDHEERKEDGIIDKKGEVSNSDHSSETDHHEQNAIFDQDYKSNSSAGSKNSELDLE